MEKGRQRVRGRRRGEERKRERQTDRWHDFYPVIQDRNFIPMGKNSKEVWAVWKYGSCHMSFQT
jgi:hypothetical protein